MFYLALWRVPVHEVVYFCNRLAADSARTAPLSGGRQYRRDGGWGTHVFL